MNQLRAEKKVAIQGRDQQVRVHSHDMQPLYCMLTFSIPLDTKLEEYSNSVQRGEAQLKYVIYLFISPQFRIVPQSGRGLPKEKISSKYVCIYAL